jgi:hypothetical protein
MKPREAMAGMAGLKASGDTNLESRGRQSAQPCAEAL